MRARGPYEVKPEQLRALVVLLMLLPLIPTAFVARFMLEAVYAERSEARERERPIYQKFLDTAGATLATNLQRQLASAALSDYFKDGFADAVVSVAPDGRLTSLPGSNPPLPLARAVVDAGARLDGLPGRRANRWRFLLEASTPIFALSPPASGSPVLLLKSRQHLLKTIRSFFARALDPDSVLVLLDENGDSVPLSGDGVPSGPPLAETALKAPLPVWRIQLFSPSASLVDAAGREQFVFYFGTIGGVLVVTVAIAGLAGYWLSRRIVLRELSNDALAVASHEMKTPLASVRLLVETLLERRYSGGPAQADEYLRLIEQENRRLERLVEGFAMLSRIERNRGRLVSVGVVEAREIIAAACAQLRTRLDAADFAVDAGEELPPFPGDADALTAVLVNLLDNALKYSGDSPRIRLRAHTVAGHILFEVSDRGPGIAREEQERIFERFYQVDHRLSRTHSGLGLGLSIVRSIVRAHGGEVTVASSPGAGATFTVRLPLDRSKNALPSRAE